MSGAASRPARSIKPEGRPEHGGYLPAQLLYQLDSPRLPDRAGVGWVFIITRPLACALIAELSASLIR